MKLSFSKNLHDEDGDVYQEGIFIHFGENFIFRGSNIDDLEDLIDQLQQIKEEICEK